jgi:HK97 family phage major capsid protein
MKFTNHYTAFLVKMLAHRGAYERRAAPDLNQLGATIDGIATAFDAYKVNAEAKMARMARELEMAETRRNRPGAMHEARAADPMTPTATREQRAALGRWARTGDMAAFAEAKARVTSASGDGADAVVPWLNTDIQTQALQNSELLSRVRRRVVTNFPAKTIISTGAGFEWAGESTARSETDAPQPKVIEIPAAEWSAKPIVSNWALQDLQFDVESWLMSELTLAYVGGLMAAIISGDGLSRPKGILSMPTAAGASPALGTIRRFVTGQAATLPTTAATMVTMLQQVSGSLAWQYRPGAAWFMNNATLQIIRAVRDLQDRPLFVDSLVLGGQNALLGYPVIEVEAMPDVGANALPIIFGNVDLGYLLCTDTSMQLTRDAITESGFTKFYTRTRVGGSATDTAALRVIRVSAT